MKSSKGSIKKVIPAFLALAALLAVTAGGLCAKNRTRGAEVVIEDAQAIRIVRESNVLSAILEGRSRERVDFDGIGRQPRIGAPPAAKDGHFDTPKARRAPRLHLSFESGFSTFGETASLKRLFKKMGFGDTDPGGYSDFRGSYGPTAYPRAQPDLSRGFTAEYSLNRSFAVGLSFAVLGNVTVKGFRMIPRDASYWSPLYASAASAAESYFITAAWRPIPGSSFKRYSFKLGVELGICAARMTFGTMKSNIESNFDKRTVTKAVPAAGLVAGMDRYFGRTMSLGAWARYRYASTRVGAFSLDASYYDGLDAESNLIEIPITVAFPAYRFDLGGLSAGVSLGLHI